MPMIVAAPVHRTIRHTFLAFLALALTSLLPPGNALAQVGGGSTLTQQPGVNSGPNAQRPTLIWTLPTRRENGLALTPDEIAAIIVHFRPQFQSASLSLALGGQSTAFSLQGFPPGIYDFAVQALDDEGRFSQRSQWIRLSLL